MKAFRVQTLSTKELQERLDYDNKFQLWNVQTDEFFTGELVPGSRWLPLNTIERAATGIEKNVEVITYSGGPQCPQCREAARRLIGLGYTRVRVYADGLKGWKEAGHPTERLHVNGLNSRNGNADSAQPFRSRIDSTDNPYTFHGSDAA